MSDQTPILKENMMKIMVTVKSFRQKYANSNEADPASAPNDHGEQKKRRNYSKNKA